MNHEQTSLALAIACIVSGAVALLALLVFAIAAGATYGTTAAVLACAATYAAQTIEYHRYANGAPQIVAHLLVPVGFGCVSFLLSLFGA
jgi:hypothetical protein